MSDRSTYNRSAQTDIQTGVLSRHRPGGAEFHHPRSQLAAAPRQLDWTGIWNGTGTNGTTGRNETETETSGDKTKTERDHRRNENGVGTEGRRDWGGTGRNIDRSETETKMKPEHDRD